MLVSMWRKKNISPLIVTMEIGSIMLDINLVVPQKTGNISTWRPSVVLKSWKPQRDHQEPQLLDKHMRVFIQAWAQVTELPDGATGEERGPDLGEGDYKEQARCRCLQALDLCEIVKGWLVYSTWLNHKEGTYIEKSTMTWEQLMFS